GARQGLLQAGDRLQADPDQGGVAPVAAAQQEARAHVTEAAKPQVHGPAVGPGDVILGGRDAAADVHGPGAGPEEDGQFRRGWSAQGVRPRPTGPGKATLGKAKRRSGVDGPSAHLVPCACSSPAYGPTYAGG